MINQLVVVLAHYLEQPPVDGMPYKPFMQCKQAYARRIWRARKICFGITGGSFVVFGLLGWILTDTTQGLASGLVAGCVTLIVMLIPVFAGEDRQTRARDAIWNQIVEEQLPSFPASWLTEPLADDLRQRWLDVHGVDEETFLALAKDNDQPVSTVTDAVGLLLAGYASFAAA